MNAFFGYIEFRNSEDYSEKNRHFIDKVFLAFPSRFPGKKSISHNNIFVAGGFESFYTEDKENPRALYLHGEIYNQQEIKNILGISSTIKNDASLIFELIQQKGIESIELINGQFLIIYTDYQKQKIYFFNDHLGVRQFYYYQNKNLLLFGSEIKFLLPHADCPKEIDWETSLKRPNPDNIYCFKSYKTWFKEINLLPEAYVIEADLKKNTIKFDTYWSHSKNFNYDHKEDRRTAENVMEEYIGLLEDAVKIRTNKNAVNYSLLSGGLDSSAIVALCAKYGPTETFSIITQTTYVENTTKICYDLANDLGVKNSQFLIPMHKIVFNADLWQQWIWRMESPVNHTDSLTKTLLHYAIKKNYPQVKTVLTGTGSDQFNGGLARYILKQSGNQGNDWESLYNQIKDIENQKLISRDNVSFWNYRDYVHRSYLASISPNKYEIENNLWMFYVKAALHSEVFSLCWDEVRASGYHGHETRFPFLDFRFMDFIAKIPPQLHKDLFFDKPILRTPLKKILPEYVLNKPKAPYNIPDYNYDFRLFNFLTSDMSLVEEALGSIDTPHPVINKAAVVNKIKLLQQKPDIIGWQNVMHIINLGLLEKIVGKNEKEMDIELLVQQPSEVNFSDNKKTKLFLENELSIINREIDINKPVSFCDNCFFLFDKLHNKFFLSKNNMLVFEIEDQYKEWKSFLTGIDNKKSTKQLLNDLTISLDSIEEFLKMAIEEKILMIN